MISFASDNHAGILPEVLRAIESVNEGFAPAYGADVWTQKAKGVFAKEFGPDVGVFFTFIGSAANVLGLSSILSSFESVICAESAHLNVDECGAPEAWIGTKLLTIPTTDGKLSPALIEAKISISKDVHKTQARVISISQTTEYGTVYSLGEVKALSAFAKDRGLWLHMDGARLPNACAALGCGFAQASSEVGVDLLSFGGTKNGLMAAEAIVSFRPEINQKLMYIQKQGLQLASKMRFVSAQFLAFFENDLWLKNAKHANDLARALEKSIKDVPGVKITQKVQANAIFARLPRVAIEALQKEFMFYIWDEKSDEVRWMTSFQTSPQMVELFASKIRSACQAAVGVL